MVSYLTISIFYEQANWSPLLKEILTPLIDHLTNTGDLEKHDIEFNHDHGPNVRLTICVCAEKAEPTASYLDKYLKTKIRVSQKFNDRRVNGEDHLFKDFPTRSVQYGLFTARSLPLNSPLSRVSQTLTSYLSDLCRPIFTDPVLIEIAICFRAVWHATLLNSFAKYRNKSSLKPVPDLVRCRSTTSPDQEILFESIFSENQTFFNDIYEKIKKGDRLFIASQGLGDWDDTCRCLALMAQSAGIDKPDLATIHNFVNRRITEQLGLHGEMGLLTDFIANRIFD